MDDDGFEHTPARDGWRRLIAKGEGWDSFEGHWKHLAPTPDGYVVDDVSWVRTVPARQRMVPQDAPESADTSTVQVIHRLKPDDDDEVEWEEDADIAVGADGVIDIADGAVANVQDDGTVVYDGGSDAGAVAGQVLSDGSVRLAVTIPDENAPRSFAVPMTMPEFMTPSLQPDGRVLILTLVDTDNPYSTVVEPDVWEIVYEMPPPWAKDANGADVKTWYTMDGTVLTQHIEPTADTAWPVVADPTAKQNKQAAKARDAAEDAKKAANRAKEAAAAAEKARAQAALKLQKAEEKLLAAQRKKKDQQEKAEKAKKAAELAQKAAAEAKRQAKAAAEAAKAAREAAARAKKAAASKLLEGAKKLQTQAKEAARRAETQANRAVQHNQTAQTAKAAAVAMQPAIDDAATTATKVVAIYENADLAKKKQQAAAQNLLNKYVERVKERRSPPVPPVIPEPPAPTPRMLTIADESRVYNVFAGFDINRLDCAPNIVIGARGSGQPRESAYGLGDFVHDIVNAMNTQPGQLFRANVSSIAIDYRAPGIPVSASPSVWADYVAGSRDGVQSGARLVAQVREKCAGSLIHMIGYSSGAWVVGGAYASVNRVSIGSVTLLSYPAAWLFDHVKRVVNPMNGHDYALGTIGIATLLSPAAPTLSALNWTAAMSDFHMQVHGLSPGDNRAFVMPPNLAGGGLSSSDTDKVIQLCIIRDAVCDVAGFDSFWNIASLHVHRAYAEWVIGHLSQLNPRGPMRAVSK